MCVRFGEDISRTEARLDDPVGRAGPIRICPDIRWRHLRYNMVYGFETYLWKWLLCHWNTSFLVFWGKTKPAPDLNDQFLTMSLAPQVIDFWNPNCLTRHHLMLIQQFLFQYVGYWKDLHPRCLWNMFRQLDQRCPAKPTDQQMDRIRYRTKIRLKIYWFVKLWLPYWYSVQEHDR